MVVLPIGVKTGILTYRADGMSSGAAGDQETGSRTAVRYGPGLGPAPWPSSAGPTSGRLM